jgi:hypothetical protein
MSEPTPGPWAAAPCYSGPDWEIYDSEPWMLCTVYDGVDGAFCAQANARLIASAPDLLEAAERIASNNYFSVDDEFEQLEAAIKKARGGT